MSDDKPTKIEGPIAVVKEFSCEARIGPKYPPNPAVRLSLVPLQGQSLECVIGANQAIEIGEKMVKEAQAALTLENKRRFPDHS